MEPEYLTYLKEHRPDLHEQAVSSAKWAAEWRENIIRDLCNEMRDMIAGSGLDAPKILVKAENALPIGHDTGGGSC